MVRTLTASEERDGRILVITFDANMHGWAAVLRTSPDEPGEWVPHDIEVVGGYRTAVDLLGSASINPAALPDCPVVQVCKETLADLLATQAASKIYPLAQHSVLIHSDCLGAIAALRKGLFRTPALQKALLHNRVFMDVGAAPAAVESARSGGCDEGGRRGRSLALRCPRKSTAALRRIVTS